MSEFKDINIEEYDYPLPENKIAFYPVNERDSSKLLVYKDKKITDALFYQISDFLDDDCLLIFNDSKVIHARLPVHNETMAEIEIFCLEPLFPTTELATAFQQTKRVIWKCLVGNAKRWKKPLTISVPIGEKTVEIRAEKGENADGTFQVTFEWADEDITFAEWIEHYGKMPLPPYIKRNAEKEDENRYQTVYAKYDGSVAAPTAGLHFTEREFDALRKKGIGIDYLTLHVGAGTFKPVSSQFICDHFMHREQILIKPELLENLLRSQSKRIIAVGTTVARTLESLFIMGAKLTLGLDNPFKIEQWEIYDNPAIAAISTEESLTTLLKYLKENNLEYLPGSTSLIIVPGYQHKMMKGLITNFHQPKSTLLLLISSIVGNDWKDIYRHALNNGYRFLSYGDSNLYL